MYDLSSFKPWVPSLLLSHDALQVPRHASLVTAMLLVLAGCTQAPHDQLEAAEKTVREAENVGAPTYVPEQYGVLVAKVEAAKGEIDAQYKVSEFSRDYSRAHHLLAQAQSDADRIIAEAQKRREEAKTVALREKEQADQAVRVVRDLVERIDRGSASSPGKAPDELRAEADGLNRKLAEVQTAIEANNHLEAQNKAKAVKDESQKLQQQVRTTRRQTD
jgi:hypothetical protein